MICIKYILFVIILVLMPSLQARASALVIHMKKGGQVTFALEQKPIVSFVSDNLIINSEKTSYSVSIEGVASYDFIPVTTDVDNRQIKDSNPIISKEHVVFAKLGNDSIVYVYTMDGQCISSYNVDNTGSVDVNLNSLPKGICILKSPVTTIKIAIK